MIRVMTVDEAGVEGTVAGVWASGSGSGNNGSHRNNNTNKRRGARPPRKNPSSNGLTSQSGYYHPIGYESGPSAPIHLDGSGPHRRWRDISTSLRRARLITGLRPIHPPRSILIRWPIIGDHLTTAHLLPAVFNSRLLLKLL
ncbi:transcriptional regulator [Puccinia graminis f. sp. tritici]|uniref:Transcriptional regulator n=1 Tax=Puccinia graminis f. sp. tritici TaxID=56615 RepID=A0A5B0Q477_PUCGR|nr:transcriptional regulator [Puccinia graminis f. sp. tritici]